MKKIIKMLFSIVITIGIIYSAILIFEKSLATELKTTYKSDLSGDYTGAKYFEELIEHTSMLCNEHNKPYFFNRPEIVVVSGKINGKNVYKTVVNADDNEKAGTTTYRIWGKKKHGNCVEGKEATGMTLQVISYSGMNSETVNSSLAVSASIPGTVSFTGTINYESVDTTKVSNNAEAYILAEASSNYAGLWPENSYVNVAWWNVDNTGKWTSSSAGEVGDVIDEATSAGIISKLNEAISLLEEELAEAKEIESEATDDDDDDDVDNDDDDAADIEDTRTSVEIQQEIDALKEQIAQYNSGTTSGSTSSSGTTGSGGYSSTTAKGLVHEAGIFESMHNQINKKGSYENTIQDNTKIDAVTVVYDSVNQEYIVGPFNISYLEVYAYDNQFAGMTGTPQLTLLQNGKKITLNLGNGWEFYWAGARSTSTTLGDSIPEGFNSYPHTGENFYIKIDYKTGVNKICGIKFNFKYLTASATYKTYDGSIEVWECEASNVIFKKCNKKIHNDDGSWERCKNYNAAYVKITLSKSENDISTQGLIEVEEAKRSFTSTTGGFDSSGSLGSGTAKKAFEWNIDLTTTVAGDVWLDEDAQKTNDYVQGVKDSGESGIGNIAVTVYLYQGTSKKRTAIAHDSNGNQLSWPIYTDQNGHWEISRLEAPGIVNGSGSYFYVVEFEYDGQVYKNTVYLGNSNSVTDEVASEGSVSAYNSSPNSYSSSSMAVETVENRYVFDQTFGEITGETSIDGDNNTTGVTNTTNESGKKASSNSDSKYNEVVYEGETTDNGVLSTLDSPATANGSLTNPAKVTSVDSSATESKYQRYRMAASTFYDNTSTYGVSVTKSDYRIQYPLSTTYTMNANKVGSNRYISEYMLHINLGLTERAETDASVLKDLYKITLVVNEQKVTKEYNPYGDTSDYEDFLIKLEENKASATYTLGLYGSDVRYQSYNRYGNAISQVLDIKDGTELKVYVTYAVRVYNNSGTNDLEINELTDYYDSTYTLVTDDVTTSIVGDDMKRENTLVAEAPYYRVLSQQGTYTWEATREENLEADGVISKGNITWNEESTTNGYKTQTTNSLTELKLTNSQYVEIFTTYEVDKEGYNSLTGSENANVDALEARKNLVGTKYNVAEISNYSTYYTSQDIISGHYSPYKSGWVSGRVDKDSAPNNIDRNNVMSDSKYEDDTYQSNSLDIKIETYDREMYGYVWDDAQTEELKYNIDTGDGHYNSSEDTLIGNVEVSLYEVINLGEVNSDGSYDGTYDGLEYYYKVPDSLYFGTESDGSLTEGKSTTSTSEVTSIISESTVSGNYYLYGFLAGDYVVRFDYGTQADSTTTLADGTEVDIVKYNGQDYENTGFLAELTEESADTYLNIKYLDLTGETTIDGTDISDLTISKARDNESRRMVVDSYSRNIENDRGEILRDRLADGEFIEATQMFAETPVMQIEITDPQTIDQDTYEGEKVDPYSAHIKRFSYTKRSSYTIQNINFGLEERAGTDIVLEKYIYQIFMIKNDEIVFNVYMDDSGEVIKEKENSSGLEELTYISHSKAIDETAGLYQQGFYVIEVEDDYLDGVTLSIGYKIKVINNSETDFTGLLEGQYLSEAIEELANETPTTSTYEYLTNIVLDSANEGISMNSTLAAILQDYYCADAKVNGTGKTLADLLGATSIEDLTSANANIATGFDSLRPEATVYGKYVGRYYYINQICDSEATYTITNYSKNADAATINVTYMPDNVVTTTVDQLVDYIDVNASLDEEYTNSVIDASWYECENDSDGDGKLDTDENGYITSLDKLISKDSYYSISGDLTLADEKGRALVTATNSNVAISYSEVIERDEDNANRMKYKTNSSLSSYNPSLTGALVPADYATAKGDSEDSYGEIDIWVSKNMASQSDADEAKIDNLAEVLVYSNSTGRRDINSVPGNAMALIATDQNQSFWTSGYNSIEAHKQTYLANGGTEEGWQTEQYNWLKYPENDAWSPEYVTIIPPTGIALKDYVVNNIVPIVVLTIVLVVCGGLFIQKQIKISKNSKR